MKAVSHKLLQLTLVFAVHYYSAYAHAIDPEEAGVLCVKKHPSGSGEEITACIESYIEGNAKQHTKKQSVDHEVIDGQILSTRYAPDGQGFYVDVRNAGNIKISCIVTVDYSYPANGALKAERTSINTGMILAGGTGTAKLNSNYNIRANNFSTHCSKWPFR